jgi:aarF domain-containing kinase
MPCRPSRWALCPPASSGAAFIKWGQWSSTREDIFPPAFCRVLSELHDRAPVHSFEEVRRAALPLLPLPLAPGRGTTARGRALPHPQRGVVS